MDNVKKRAYVIRIRSRICSDRMKLRQMKVMVYIEWVESGSASSSHVQKHKLRGLHRGETAPNPLTGASRGSAN